jgi:DNA processing protein
MDKQLSPLSSSVHRDDLSGQLELDDAQRLAWLQLIRSERVGIATFRHLVNHYGSAAEALEHVPELHRRSGGKPYQSYPREKAEQEMEEAARIGARFVVCGEPLYPKTLTYIEDAPPILCMQGGNEALIKKPALAIVGSRNSSIAGCKMTERLAHDLSDAGFTIVSGLARGIDTVAHRASLKRGTIAVLAGGPEQALSEG